jgi:hypothetical protein
VMPSDDIPFKTQSGDEFPTEKQSNDMTRASSDS